MTTDVSQELICRAAGVSSAVQLRRVAVDAAVRVALQARQEQRASERRRGRADRADPLGGEQDANNN